MTDEKAPAPEPETQPSEPVAPIGPPSGEWTADEQRTALAWINSQWGMARCPFHPVHLGWEVDKYPTWLTAARPGTLLIGGPFFPFLVVTCKACGYTALINAIKAGLMGKDGG